MIQSITPLKSSSLVERSVADRGRSVDVVDLKEPSRSHLASGPLHVEFVSSVKDEDTLDLWRELEQKLLDRSLSCSHAWMTSWLEVFGAQLPHRFAIARRGGEVRGMALIAESVDHRDGPFRIRTVHVGTAGESERDSICVEYNALLVEPEEQEEFLAEILARLQEERQWDAICLDGFEQSAVVPVLHRAGWVDGPRGRYSLLSCRESISRYHDLAARRASGGNVLSAFGSSTRSNIKRNLRAHGELVTEWAVDVSHAEAIFSDMRELHQQRWNAIGQPGCYASERFTEFHLRLLQRLVPRGEMSFFRVSNGSGVLGAVQVLIDGNRALQYQKGTAGLREGVSPGVMIDYLCMEECLRRGYDAFDFLGGDSHHKQRLSTDSATLVWVSLRRPNWKFHLARAGRWLKQRWRKYRTRANTPEGNLLPATPET